MVDRQARDLESMDSRIQDLATEMEGMKVTAKNQHDLLMKLARLTEQVGVLIG